MNRPWPRGVLRARGQRRAGSIAGAMPHMRVAGVAQQQQLSSESSTSMAVVCARVVVVSKSARLAVPAARKHLRGSVKTGEGAAL